MSANFKVLPGPRTEATIVATFPSAAEAFAAARLLHVAQEPLAALEVARLDGVWTTAARLEGREPTVDMMAKRIAASITGDPRRLDAAESAAWWDSYVARQQPIPGQEAVLVRCGVRPRDTATLAEGIVAALENLGIAVTHLAASPGIGVAVARLEFGSDGSAERLAEVQTLLLGLSDTATILAAPSAWKQGLDVWGRLPEGFEVMKSLRAEFDPARTVNPGRFAGFL